MTAPSYVDFPKCASGANLGAVLYVFPPLFILGGWAWGCRDTDRQAIIVIACVCTAAFVPALVWAMETAAELAKGCAYALAVMATSSCAMLLHIRSDPGDGGEETGDGEPRSPSGDDPSPLPIDWDEFERRFWEEVRRRGRERIPV
jgi:hypothetical protein